VRLDRVQSKFERVLPAPQFELAQQMLKDPYNVGGGYAPPQLLTGACKPNKLPKDGPHTEPTKR